MDSLTHKNIPVVSATDATAWRKWLESNHRTKSKVWLRIFKKDSGQATVSTDEAIDQAICFGWIDSVINKFDEQSFVLYFAPRNPKSNWSRVNKLKVERLLSNGLIAPAGLELIEIAKKTGTWTALDQVEDLILPPDLDQAFQANLPALQPWGAFPRSMKRAVLEQLLNTKTEQTRQKRIKEIVGRCTRNERLF